MEGRAEGASSWMEHTLAELQSQAAGPRRKHFGQLALDWILRMSGGKPCNEWWMQYGTHSQQHSRGLETVTRDGKKGQSFTDIRNLSGSNDMKIDTQMG